MDYNSRFNTNLQIETDALEALECIITATPLYDNIISDYRSLLSRFVALELRHAYREQNQLVDLMAKEGAKYD